MSKIPKNAFPKGKSGNPKGRPKGTKNKQTLLREALRQDAEDLIIRELPKIVKAVIQKAQEGDMTAAKMILDRAIPAKKAIELKSSDKTAGGINIIINALDVPRIEEKDISPSVKVIPSEN